MKKLLQKAVVIMLVIAMSVTMIPTTARPAGAAVKPMLSKKSVSILIGETIELKVKNATDAKITFRSAKPAVAVVSPKGKITAKTAGSTKIVVTVRKNGQKTKLTCKTTVKKPAVSVKKIKIAAGKSRTLKIKNQPKKGTVVWSSNNKKAATVSKKGKVKGVADGTAKITAKVTAYKKTYRLAYHVTVEDLSDKQEETPAIQEPEKETPQTNQNTQTYQVVFETNGGSKVAACMVESGKTVEKPQNPKKNGYVFDGWYSDEKLSVRYDFLTAVTNHLTLYAKWTPYVPSGSDAGSVISPGSSNSGNGSSGSGSSGNDNSVQKPVTFQVKFQTNGGSKVETAIVESGKTVVQPKNPVKDGYVFAGWHSDVALKKVYDFRMPVTANLTLYAKWTIRIVDEDDDGVELWVEKLFQTSDLKDDTDGDGLSDYIEIYFSCTDPTLTDTDNNGVSDADEDFDGDGLSNIREVQLGTAVNRTDTDLDGLSDREELDVYKTDPCNPDTDGDGLPDGDEILLGLNPLKKMSDDLTPDAERTFSQEISEDNIDSQLLAAGNAAVPSLEADMSGNINRKVMIDKAASTEFSDSRALVGEAIEVSGEDLTNARLSFRLTNGAPALLSVDGAADTFQTTLICRYREDGTTEYFDTDYNADTNTVSAQVDGDGTYFVMDVCALFDELGLNMPQVADVNALEDVVPYAASSDDQQDSSDDWNANQQYDTSNNGFSDENISTADRSEVSTAAAFSITPAAYNILPASADRQKQISSPGVQAQADIVFIIDTTGSMQPYIDNVRNNLVSFADKLKEKGISAGLALVEYRDIGVDGLNSTFVHTNGTSNWFYDTEAYKAEIAKLGATGGGDADESAVDALETARLLDMRASSGKIFILVTDAAYKTENRYGIPSMASEIALLKNEGVSCCVVSAAREEGIYRDLYEGTDGIFSNIHDDFHTEIMEIADQIGNHVVGDGHWIYLQGPVPVPVRLDEKPYQGSTVDTDGDGVPDIDELETIEPQEYVDLDEIIRVVSKGTIKNTSYGTVSAYKYRSNPIIPDTDFDGLPDDKDEEPKNHSFTGRMERYNKADELQYDSAKGRLAFQVDYRWFFEDPAKYQEDLSVLSSLFAADIYENKPDVDNDIDVQIYIDDLLTKRHQPEALLEALGMQDAKVVRTEGTDNDCAEIAIGHHYVEYNKEKKEVILVAVRGMNGSLEEWSSYFDVGADTEEYYTLTGDHPEWTNKENHKGFDVTANRVMRAIEAYTSETAGIREDAQKMYWITGHSRGGAIANIVGAALEDAKESVVTYTFGAPATTTSAKKYATIFNIVNEDDAFSGLPLENKWGFVRYGNDRKVSVSKCSGDETLLDMGGSYKGTAFKEFTGLDYVSSEKVEWFLQKFELIAGSREDLYHVTDAMNTLVMDRKAYESSSDARDAINEKMATLRPELSQLGKYEVITGKNWSGEREYYVGCYQTPAFFMQSLADWSADGTLQEVAAKYENVRKAFVATYLNGMEHPQWTETYYLIANGMYEYGDDTSGL